MSAPGDHVAASDVKRVGDRRDWVVNAAPTGWWVPLRPAEVWRHRELVWFFAVRDVKVRYKQAVLGVAWALIQPVVGAITFTILFNNFADVEVDAPSYFAFALIGSGAWTYFAGTMQSGTSSLLANADLLTKVSFPRIVAPAASFLPGFIDLAVAAILATVVAVARGARPSAVAVVVGLPLGVALLLVGLAGPVLFLGSAVVKYRDVIAIVSFGVQLLLFVSPIAYPPELVPSGWRTVMYVNPLAGALGALRWALVDTPAPTAGQLALSAAAAVIMAFVGLAYFRHTEREFADVI
jgi:ABC-type polysaccharide/polyol phosphate export permease